MKETPLEYRQRQINVRNFDTWEESSAHRDRVTTLLQERGGQNSLGLFGAGNCNDVNLLALAQSYSSITLIDLDADALQEGIERQGSREFIPITLTLSGGIDFSDGHWRAPVLFNCTVSLCVFSR